MNDQGSTMQPDALPAGIVLREYSIERVLGQGGFGITYLAHDSVFDRHVAVKEFLPTDIARRFDNSRVGPRATKFRDNFDWGLSEFLEEAKLIDRLEHPNVVRVRSFFRENDTAYLVMEYVEGPTLADWLQQRAAPKGEALIAMLRALVEGLEHMHSRNCLHRDIKPDNIILRGSRIDTPVLIDFGAARKAVAERTRSIAAIVSAGYTPLEQYSSHRTLTPAMDLYALCAVAYRCIAGEEPPAATERAIADSMPKLADRASGEYPPELLSAIDAGLALRVTDRPQNLGPLMKALGARVTTPAVVAESAPQAKAAAVSNAHLERDRRRQTMKVAYGDEPAVSAAERTMPGPVEVPRSVGDVYPLPILFCAFALLIGLAACVRFQEFIPQAAIIFPLSAFVGTWCVHWWLGKTDPPLHWRVLVFLAGYLATSLLSTVLFLVSGGTGSPAEGFILFDAYSSMFGVAKPEFVIFAAGSAALYALTGRLRQLEGPARQPLQQASTLLPAVLLLASLYFIVDVRLKNANGAAASGTLTDQSDIQPSRFPDELFKSEPQPSEHAAEAPPAPQSYVPPAASQPVSMWTDSTYTQQVRDPRELSPYHFGYPSREFAVRNFRDFTKVGDSLLGAGRVAYTKTVSFFPGYSFLYYPNGSSIYPATTWLVKEHDGSSGVLLDGGNEPVYRLAETLPIQLNDDNVADYVRFFFTVVRGKHGKFYIVESGDDVPWTPDASEAEKTRLTIALKPIGAPTRTASGDYLLKVSMLFKGELFYSDVTVSPVGRITLSNDLQVLSQLPVRAEPALP
jgi:serine/threonine protein kinase